MSAKLPPALRTEFSLERLSRMFAMKHPHVFWRHDVDYSIDCAVEMAAFEKEHGIRSVYFLRVLGEGGYNINNLDVLAKIEEIRGCGHLLGVHVDLKLQRDVRVWTGQMIKSCIEQTNMATFSHDRRVSFHMPPHSSLWKKVPGFSVASEPVWKGRYIADSRGAFKHEQPEERLERKDQIQINLHPEWWFLNDEEADELRKQEELRP